MLQNKNLNNQIGLIKGLPCEPIESPSQLTDDEESQCDGDGAIQEFKREIEERFKLSVANKLYSFPRRITSAANLISSDESSCDEVNEENVETEPMKPVSRTNRINEKCQSHKLLLTKREENKAFKKKDTSCVRDSSSHRAYEDPEVGEFDNKILKTKKKSGKERSKEKKYECWKGTKEREWQVRKRLNTEPDSYNYVDTLRAKNRR